MDLFHPLSRRHAGSPRPAWPRSGARAIARGRLGSRPLAALLVAALAAVRAADAPPPIAPVGTMVVPYHGVFAELPLGAVVPQGWLGRFLARESHGLAGHPENMGYPYDTCMLAGEPPDPPVPHGDPWWRYEQSGYFFDGLTRLSHLTDPAKLAARRDAMLAYLLAHSAGDHLGGSHEGWPNAVIGRGLWAEFSATGDQRYAAVLWRYITGNSCHIVTGRDGINAEPALLLYGQTGDPRLLGYARAVYQGCFADPASWCSAARIRNAGAPLRQHGVTAAETLKILPLIYLFDGNRDALDLARTAYAKVIADSGMPDGGVVSGENLGSAQFGSLHETCDVVDWPWSIGYLLMATGDARWADVIERAAYNALPGVLGKDFTRLQYFSAVNQMLATATSSQGPWGSMRMSFRAAHDTECCSGNVIRGMPNQVARMWMRVPADGGLAAVCYGPSRVRTTVAAHPVEIEEATDYPFRDRIAFTIHCGEHCIIPLQLRIPGWCTAASVQVNGAQVPEVVVRPGSFARLVRSFADGDVVTLTLPMAVRCLRWFDDRAASIERGPLVFSLAIDEQRIDRPNDSSETRRQLLGNEIRGFHALDVMPRGEWRYGIGAALAAAPAGIRAIEAEMPDNPFLPGSVPVRLEAPLRPLPSWLPAWDANAPHQRSPLELPQAAILAQPGPPERRDLIPFGATHLRLTTLPVVSGP